jgi:TonB family protein
VLNPNGGTPGSGKDALSVPDLYVKGGGKDIDNRPTVVARPVLPRMPTSVMSDETLRGTSRYMTVKYIGHSSGTRVANAPDPRFNGRQVYTIVVQMPNITSYVGSWMMWYSAPEDSRPLDDPIQAPTPLHKVDPKYIATAVEERVQGAVRLACLLDTAGHVTHVELVRGVDDRLDRSAVEAFRKWQFEPATRKGEPVAVDLLVEIPFRLAPRLPN